MASLQTAYTLFVGVDIAARSFTALLQTTSTATERPFTLDQTPAGYLAFQERLAATAVPPSQTLLVLEATSTYWVALAVTLHEAGYHVSVVNPEQIHHFAKSLPRRSKTDQLDAAVLGRYAYERKPACWTPPPQVYHELRQRLVARDALVSMRQQARNHRHALLQWPVVVEAVKEQLDGVITDLDERIAKLDAAVAAILADSAWTRSASLLQSIPGVGVITAAWLLVATLNFSISATPAGLAAYAGLVPIARDSGSSVRGRPRIGHGGNGRLRAALYLATLSAGRHNPLIKTFYDRLRTAGKPMKVARCAAARKLLHIAWAVVKHDEPFDSSRVRSVTAVE